jgi:predicted aldo/keto reductase-like oxidoreductase
MSDNHPLLRREFLRRSAAAAAFGLAGGLALQVPAARGQGAVEEAARKAGRLPRRKFGAGGREVSVLFGAGDLAAAPTEAAILCGVNYWHKSNAWAKDGAPETIRKNREAHYCQVTVDRVGGNHEVGRIDEEAHVAFVKDALQRTKLGYFDDLQFHYGYHNAAEITNNRGVVRAFERLKKEGLVKHLCLSQHGYAGNARVPGGESAAEILTALVEDGLYEHAQFIYSFGDDPAMTAFLEFARKKGFGTTAMKTARGLG